MAEYTEQLGLDAARLERRIHFLLDRAEHHDQEANEPSGETADLHRVCAATLRRDAAATAALLGDFDKARGLFVSAGRQWLRLGFYYGLFLLRLTNEDAVEATSEETQWIDRSLADEAEDTDAFERSFERSTRNAPRQLLSLVQAGAGRVSKGDLGWRARNRLSAAGALPIGGTAMPLRSYLKLFDALEHGDWGPADRDRLLAQFVQREELIAAAREDHFHWKLAQRPADIIDFDLLALGLASQTGGWQVQEAILELSEGRGAASVPFKLAQDLGRGREMLAQF